MMRMKLELETEQNHNREFRYFYAKAITSLKRITFEILDNVTVQMENRFQDFPETDFPPTFRAFETPNVFVP